MSDELLHNTASARFERYRQALRERLAHLEGSEGATLLFPLLVSALHDASAFVRLQAAESLGQLGQVSPEVVAALRSLRRWWPSQVR
jgi:HEAT repeat protein